MLLKTALYLQNTKSLMLSKRRSKFEKLSWIKCFWSSTCIKIRLIIKSFFWKVYGLMCSWNLIVILQSMDELTYLKRFFLLTFPFLLEGRLCFFRIKLLLIPMYQIVAHSNSIIILLITEKTRYFIVVYVNM